ncbi:hypothetical protein [Paraburkholderia sp. BCC1886]|uniref:hyaluronate lyase N-terminal domain-containing protein n=1 Tax=Paraburkholderia sp. BCC1886 TaxID=2562670 RepID=UPI001183A202|nr:hypothetical protein [Paraburkholderia sp. BCC1886]
MVTPALKVQGTVQFRRGTAAEWTAANPTLAEAEMGVELDTGTTAGLNKYKIGDGVTDWNDLPYGGLESALTTAQQAQLGYALATGLRFQVSAEPPTTRTDGSALEEADEYTNTAIPPVTFQYVSGAWTTLNTVAMVNTVPLDTFAMVSIDVQFDTLALFRAIDSTLYTTASTRGYNNVDDGGDSKYTLVATSAQVTAANTATAGTYVDDGGYQIIANDGSAWAALRTAPGVDVRKYGAIPDCQDGDQTATNCWAATVAADAYAAAMGDELLFPAPKKVNSGYLYMADTFVPLYSRVQRGAVVSGIDQGGTRIFWRPTVPMSTVPPIATPLDAANDCLPCFRNMNTGQMWNIWFDGPTPYVRQTMGTTDQYWKGGQMTRLPHYQNDLAYGFIGCDQDDQVQMDYYNCGSSATLKHGMCRTNTTGHIREFYCNWDGLIGTYTVNASDDYYRIGTNFTGVLAGFGFNNKDNAGTEGSNMIRHLDGHAGFAPFTILQFQDVSNTSGTGGGLNGFMKGIHFESCGEAAIQLLPGASTNLRLEDCVSSWSDSWENDGAWSTMLPPDMQPAIGAQAALFALGSVELLDCPGSTFARSYVDNTADSCPPAANQVSLLIDAMFPLTANGGLQGGVNVSAFDTIQLGDGTAGSFSNGQVKSDPAPRPNYELSVFPANKGDLRRYTAVAPTPNLLLNPVQMTAALGTTNNVLSGNGGNWIMGSDSSTITGYSLAALLAAGTLKQSDLPQALLDTYSSLTDDPVVIALECVTAASNIFAQLDPITRALPFPYKLLSTGTWIKVQRAANADGTPNTTVMPVMVRQAGGNYQYYPNETQQMTPDSAFMPMLFNEFAVDVPGSVNNALYEFQIYTVDNAVVGDIIWLFPPICNEGQLAQFNANNGPTLRGQVYLDEQPALTSTAAGGTVALPAGALGFATMSYNGAQVQYPVYPV